MRQRIDSPTRNLMRVSFSHLQFIERLTPHVRIYYMPQDDGFSTYWISVQTPEAIGYPPRLKAMIDFHRKGLEARDRLELSIARMKPFSLLLSPTVNDLFNELCHDLSDDVPISPIRIDTMRDTLLKIIELAKDVAYGARWECITEIQADT